MRKLRFSFHTQLQFDQPVTQHFYTLRCIPSSDGVQQLFSVNCRVAPKGNIRYNKDGFCNTIGTGCIKETHQYFSFDVEGVAFVKNEKRSVQDLDGRDAIYRYPTLLTMPDNNIKEFLTQLQIKKEDGAGGLIRLREALAKHMKYVPGTTNLQTTASQAFRQGMGVCQDYAHIYLAMARLLGYPARYMSGMMLGEGATHAWVEAAVDGKWIGIDPANDCLVDDRYICFAHGRDYADCPVERGIFLGAASQSQEVLVSVWEK